MLREIVYFGLVILILTATAYHVGKLDGQQSVKQIDRICPEQKAKLITSSHSNAGTICVYQEPWKNKGKIKRIEL
jgi:hypothetical protein